MTQSIIAMSQVGTGPSEAAETETLSEQLLQRLTDAILSGEIPLGSKISEPALARRYGVSRGPLREALHRLQERRLITRSANHGSRVVERTPKALYDLFVVREALEGIAVHEAVLRCTNEDISAFRASILLDEEVVLGTAKAGQPTQLSPYHDFHFLIAHASRNPVLIQLLCQELYPLLRLFRANANTPLQRQQQTVVEHKRILSAIKERDAELAEILMRRHIAAARRSREILYPIKQPGAWSLDAAQPQEEE